MRPSRFLILLAFFADTSAESATLEEAVNAAQAKSSLVGISEKQANQSRAQLWRGRFTLLPSVFLEGAYTLNQREITMDPLEWLPEEYADFIPGDFEPTVIQQKEYLSANLRVDQTLFDARTLPVLRAAGQGVAAAEANVERAKRLLKSQVAQMAYQVQATREASDLARRAVTMAQVQQDMADTRKQLGSGARREQLQAQLAYSQAQRELRRAEEMEQAAELAFSQLTGFERDVRLDLQEQLDLPSSLEQAQALARRHRSDLRAALSQMNASKAMHSASKWSFLPRLSASFVTTYTENTVFSEYPTAWLGMVNAQWALWDGGGYRAQVATDRANWRMAQMAEEDTRYRVEREVEAAWGALARSRQAHSAVKVEVALAKENLDLAEASLPTGAASWVDVERARLGMQSASLAELRERMSLRLSEIQLLVATGRY